MDALTELCHLTDDVMTDLGADVDKYQKNVGEGMQKNLLNIYQLLKSNSYSLSNSISTFLLRVYLTTNHQQALTMCQLVGVYFKCLIPFNGVDARIISILCMRELIQRR